MRARVAAAYLVAQGIGVIAWWAAMAADDTIRDWFVGDQWQTLRLYAVADVPTAGLGSIIVGLGLRADHAWRRVAHAALIGSYAVATLVAFAWAFAPVSRPLGIVCMTPAFALTVLTWRAEPA